MLLSNTQHLKEYSVPIDYIGRGIPDLYNLESLASVQNFVRCSSPIKPSMKETSIKDLHESLFINILTFVPIQFIIRCRCVCKNWASLIAQPYFVEFYDSCGRAPIQFLVVDTLKPHQLFLAQLDEASCTASSSRDFLIPSKVQFSLKFIDKFYPNRSSYTLRVFSTCRVTGCIAAYTCKEDDIISPQNCHIFNPLTGQHILVEKTESTRGDHYYRWEMCALVFAQKTNKLKLLLFSPSNFEEVSVYIQTIGTNLWRRLARILFYPFKKPFPSFANGFYYWLDINKHVLYSFDGEEEVFEQIETPICIKNSNSSDLGVLNGSLCIYMEFAAIEIWVMSKNDNSIESWSKKLVIDNDWIWSDKSLHPLKYLENGEFVMLRVPFKALCYNPSTGDYKRIRFGGKDSFKNRYKYVPYTPSLRSVLPANSLS